MTQKTISLTVDGKRISVPEGSSLLDAAKAADRHVPTLCNSDALKPFGACRVCLVQLDSGRMVASCHTPAVEGASFRTQGGALQRIRRNIVELIVSDHPLECLGCPANGRCELQTVAADVGFREVRYDNPEQHHPAKDFSHPFLKLDMDKCIACARCVRVCDEVQGSFILGMEGRGFDLRVIAGNDTGMSTLR